MSGVMIKMGVYGLLRVGLDLLGGGPAWWGGLVLVAGAVSALLGVLYALMEHDLKRLLAYHSVENIGIIFIGLGAGLMFQSYGLGTLAALGFVGGLYHTLNHACFKSLLFLGAGARAPRDRQPQHGGAGRPHQAHAAYRPLLPGRAPPPSPRCRRSTASSPSGWYSRLCSAAPPSRSPRWPC